MKRHSIMMVTVCALLLFLLPVLGLVTTLLTADDGYHGRHSDTHKRWKRDDDDNKSRTEKLEKRVQALRDDRHEGPIKRKAENILKQIHDRFDRQRDIPGEIYKLTVDLSELLETV